MLVHIDPNWRRISLSGVSGSLRRTSEIFSLRNKTYALLRWMEMRNIIHTTYSYSSTAEYLQCAFSGLHVRRSLRRVLNIPGTFQANASLNGGSSRRGGERGAEKRPDSRTTEFVKSRHFNSTDSSKVRVHDLWVCARRHLVSWIASQLTASFKSLIAEWLQKRHW